MAEGQLCQMSAKTLHPICGGAGMDECFDMATRKLVIDRVSTRAVYYSRVVDWTEGAS